MSDLELNHVAKSFKVHGRKQVVLRDCTMSMNRGEKVGIIGYNGAGKSTLMKIIGGVDQPTSGTVKTDMSISWPLGFSGAFQGSLNGLDNLKFICRVYGKDYEKCVNYVNNFAEIGNKIYDPVKTYSSGMRARLAFALSLIISFDCYLIDEVIAVGDARFSEKCQKEFFDKNSKKAMILITHNLGFVKEVCDRALFLKDGKLYEPPYIDDAVEWYHAATKEQSSDCNHENND